MGYCIMGVKMNTAAALNKEIILCMVMATLLRRRIEGQGQTQRLVYLYLHSCFKKVSSHCTYCIV